MKGITEFTRLVYDVIQEVKESEQYRKSLLFGIDITQKVPNITSYHILQDFWGYKSDKFVRVVLEREGIHELYFREDLIKRNHTLERFMDTFGVVSNSIQFILFVDSDFFINYDINYDCRKYLICCTTISSINGFKSDWLVAKNVRFSREAIQSLKDYKYCGFLECLNLCLKDIKDMKNIEYITDIIKFKHIIVNLCVEGMTVRASMDRIGETLSTIYLNYENIKKLTLKIDTTGIHKRPVRLHCSSIAYNYFKDSGVYVVILGERMQEEKEAIVSMLGDRVSFI